MPNHDIPRHRGGLNTKRATKAVKRIYLRRV
jgi:hypothetical protein